MGSGFGKKRIVIGEVKRPKDAKIGGSPKQIVLRLSVYCDHPPSMAQHGHVLCPSEVLKEMSIKRQELEQSTKEIKRSFEIQKEINEKQEKQLGSSPAQLRRQKSTSLTEYHRKQQLTGSLTEFHRKQPDTKQIPLSSLPGKLRSEQNRTHDATGSSAESSDGIRTPDRRASVDPEQVAKWRTSDVIEWLEDRQLHNFTILFQRHRVLGQDLVDINLPFLDEQDHIIAADKEHFLSELYKLLHPTHDTVSREGLEKITSRVERKKYLAAVQLATKADLAMSQSVSMFELPVSSRASSMLSINATAVSKQRTLSDSSSPKLLPPPRLKRRKATLHSSIKERDESDSRVNIHRIPRRDVSRSLYEMLKDSGYQCLECIQLHRQHDGFGLTLGKDDNGCFVVDSVEDDLTVPVFVGDRVLEMNGVLTLQSTGTVNAQVDEISQTSQSLQLVLSRDLSSKVQARSDRTNRQPDWKWTRLREFLIEMRDKDSNPEELLKYFSPAQLQNFNLTMITGKDKNENFQKMLGKESVKGENDGESQNYAVTLENLNLDTATKDDVVTSLKEIVKEASRQKWYLDRLISLVIEEAPWLLEQIDSDLENLNLHHTDEFC